MRNALLVLSNVGLFLLAAKAHGRELRLERVAAGFPQVVFGSPDTPPLVEALWHRERVWFWVLALALVAFVASALVARARLAAG